jgi:hypothetical protein
MVFHDPSHEIGAALCRLDEAMSQRGYAGCTVHAGPLVGRYKEFKPLARAARKEIFDIFFDFVRTADIRYRTFVVEMKLVEKRSDFKAQIIKKLSDFLQENAMELLLYERVVIHHDKGGGSGAFGNIIATTFRTHCRKVRVKIVSPADCRLFQAADMLCTLELIALKMERGALSKSELCFFSSAEDLEREYLSAVRAKRF